MNFIDKIVNKSLPYVIAEIGINHNGSISLAKKMIDAAKENLADCVKFQLFIADEYISDFADKADYQNHEQFKSQTQKQIIKETQLNIDDIQELKEYSENINIDFLCTPFDITSLKSLTKLNLNALKISSCNLTNYPFLNEAALSNIPVLLSTGMSTMQEVEKAVNIFKSHNCPLLLFQCTSNYPSKTENANLNVLKSFKKKFDVPLGLSDHTQNNLSAIGAVALGAIIIEKHFTTSRELSGIDQSASITPNELKKLVEDIRGCKLALGSYEKKRSEEENNTFKALRRSLVASRDIKKNEIISIDMISIMRPGNGLSTEYLSQILGKKSISDISRHHLIKLSDIEN
ncbi:MAG: N-acetylneuraminate synthase [Rhodospirillaceae bacterium]|nr:N-acetylneuraminate synthase [Rhodospirillaceae bacterium]|tara:strand:+ start:1560 stop:2597 length:1038 start_codon:yes stop_codon:yes gene_type:complete